MKPVILAALAIAPLAALSGCNSVDTTYSPLRYECPHYMNYAVFSPAIASSCGTPGALAPPSPPPPAPAPQ